MFGVPLVENTCGTTQTICQRNPGLASQGGGAQYPCATFGQLCTIREESGTFSEVGGKKMEGPHSLKSNEMVCTEESALESSFHFLRSKRSGMSI